LKSFLKRMFRLRYAGYYLPAALVTAWLVVAGASYAGLGDLRIGFYALLMASLYFGLRALVRSGRAHVEASGEWPSLYHLVVVYEKVALSFLCLGLVGAFINNLVPEVDFLPRWFVMAQVGASAVALSITNLVLEVAGKSGHLSRPVDPGLLRPLFGRRKE
jgi:hypothetical protein